MTTATATANVASAYPMPLDVLVPKVRSLVEQRGEMPSRNQVMAEFKVGARKASAALTAVADSTTPAGSAGSTVDPVSTVVAGSAQDDLADSAPAAALDLGPGPESELTAPVVTNEPTIESDDETDEVAAVADGQTAQVDGDADPEPLAAQARVARVKVARWPLLLLALPAFVAIWGGWVGLGGMSGFGMVQLLPGIADGVRLNTAITLPVGMETYAAYALKVWLTPGIPYTARQFAKWSACGALVLGAAGQVAYHLMAAAHLAAAPWGITTVVACLPVAVLGCAAALIHLIHTTDHDDQHDDETAQPVRAGQTGDVTS